MNAEESVQKMNEIVMDNPRILTLIFDSISRIVDEVEIQFGEDSLIVNALDKKHVMFVALEIPKDGFQEYSVPEPVTLAVDTDELMKILKRGRRNDDYILLEIDDPVLRIIFDGDMKRTFTIKTFNLQESCPAPPTLNYESEFKIESPVLEGLIRDCDVFSDKVTFAVDPDMLKLKSQSDYGEVICEYLHGNSDVNYAEAIFSLEFIKNVLKAVKIADWMELSMGNEMPLAVELNNKEYGIKMNYLLAPRIEAED